MEIALSARPADNQYNDADDEHKDRDLIDAMHKLQIHIHFFTPEKIAWIEVKKDFFQQHSVRFVFKCRP